MNLQKQITNIERKQYLLKYKERPNSTKEELFNILNEKIKCGEKLQIKKQQKKIWR